MKNWALESDSLENFQVIIKLSILISDSIMGKLLTLHLCFPCSFQVHLSTLLISFDTKQKLAIKIEN